MSSPQDLLAILNQANAARGASRGGATTSGSTETSVLSFKAGKMNTTLKDNGKYMVEPDARRGELHVVWTSASSTGAGSTSATGAAGTLQLQWKDRRTKTIVNTIPILATDEATFERIETGKEGDRVYLLSCGDAPEGRHFFWMQDKNSEPDVDLCVKVNLYMSDFAEAATAAGANAPSDAAADTSATAGGTGAGGDGMDNAELLRIMQGALGSQGMLDTEGARTTTVPGSNSIPTATAGQVDALGNILENLGMPQPNGTPAGERSTTAAGSGNATAGAGGAGATAGAGAGGLTLADLQAAMGGLATAGSPAGAAAASAGPPLSEFASSDIIDSSGILDDPATVERLVALLPEGQRTESKLRENIRSPQVAQCLQRLTGALADDASSFNSIIANFQLNPSDGAVSLATGNPIEAFLNCLLKDVERKEGIKKVDEAKEEEGKQEEKGDVGGKESKEGGGKEDDKMDES